MPLNWANMALGERAQAILDDIDGLDDPDVASVLEEWKSSGTDELQDLIRLALDRVAIKRGCPTSAERARLSLRRRGVIE